MELNYIVVAVMKTIRLDGDKMAEVRHKTIFDKDITEKLSLISIKMLNFMYEEIEHLDLNEREKIMAHYWVIKNYMDGIKKALDDMGIRVEEVDIIDKK